MSWLFSCLNVIKHDKHSRKVITYDVSNLNDIIEFANEYCELLWYPTSGQLIINGEVVEKGTYIVKESKFNRSYIYLERGEY